MNIWSYIFRRLLYVIPVIFGVCAIIYVLFNLVSPDPTIIMLGKHATAKQALELRRELGLDRPWFYQYLDVVKSAFTFNFGRSWSTKQEIMEMIKVGAIPSLTLSVPAFVFPGLECSDVDRCYHSSCSTLFSTVSLRRLRRHRTFRYQR